MSKKIKRINIEVDFHDFNELRTILRQLVDNAESGIPYGYESPFGLHTKCKYEYVMDFIEKRSWEERIVDGEIHLIVKSRV